ncbi:unnamed protein product [Cyclocybe aegerita]|uniref:Uncharacterized protein n=1 Tax=Cyclocybe aegerita TaxID=1973307 RepID=A0A8S0W369_CYCAE|nr:unnamed protein product [Cyclocybe aegerita]
MLISLGAPQVASFQSRTSTTLFSSSISTSMRYPKLVALDLDGTVWYHWLNDKKFKKRVTHNIADNLEAVGHHKVRDKKNHANFITISPDVPRIITELALRKIDIAIVSRNTSKALCDRALWYFKARDPETKQMRPITDFIKYDEVKDESKQKHFKRIKNWSGYEYHDMLIFDDQPLNLEVETWEGVTFKLVKHHNDGLTWQDYLDGLDEWRKNQYIRVAHPPRLIDPHPNKMLIGYAGTDRETALLYAQGKRRQFTKRPARFGYGLYASDNPQVAMFFSQWGRDSGDNKVCEIFVRDKDVFLNELKKIWFYPKKGYLTDNQHATAEDMPKCRSIATSIFTSTTTLRSHIFSSRDITTCTRWESLTTTLPLIRRRDSMRWSSIRRSRMR